MCVLFLRKLTDCVCKKKRRLSEKISLMVEPVASTISTGDAKSDDASNMQNDRTNALEMLGGIVVVTRQNKQQKLLKHLQESFFQECPLQESFFQESLLATCLEIVPYLSSGNDDPEKALGGTNAALERAKTHHMISQLITLRKANKPYLILEDSTKTLTPFFWNHISRFLVWGSTHDWSVCSLDCSKPNESDTKRWATPNWEIPTFLRQTIEHGISSGYLLHPSFAPTLAQFILQGSQVLTLEGITPEVRLNFYDKQIQNATNVWYTMVPGLLECVSPDNMQNKDVEATTHTAISGTTHSASVTNVANNDQKKTQFVFPDQSHVDRVLSTFTGPVNNSTDKVLFSKHIRDCALTLSKLPGATVSPVLKLAPLRFRVPGGNASICAMNDKSGYVMVVRRNNWFDGKLVGEPVLMNDNTIVVLDLQLQITRSSLLVDRTCRKKHSDAQWRGFEDVRIYHADRAVFYFTSTTFENEAGNSPQIGRGMAVYDEESHMWMVVRYTYLQRLVPAGEKNWLVFRDPNDQKTKVLYHWFPRFQIYELEAAESTSLSNRPLVDYASPSLARLYEGSCAPLWWAEKKTWVAMVHLSTTTDKQPWGQFYHRLILMDAKTLAPYAQSPLFLFCDDSINEYSCGMAWFPPRGLNEIVNESVNGNGNGNEKENSLVVSFGLGDRATRWVRIPLANTLNRDAFWTPLGWSQHNLASLASKRWWLAPPLLPQRMRLVGPSLSTGSEGIVLVTNTYNSTSLQNWWRTVSENAHAAKRSCWLLIRDKSSNKNNKNEILKHFAHFRDCICVVTEAEMKAANPLHVEASFTFETSIVLWWKWANAYHPQLCKHLSHVTFLHDSLIAVDTCATLDRIPTSLKHFDFLAKDVEPWSPANRNWYWWNETRSRWTTSDQTTPPINIADRWKCYQTVMRLSVRAIEKVLVPLLGQETAFGEVFLPTVCVRAGLFVGAIPNDCDVWSDTYGSETIQEINETTMKSIGFYGPVKRL